MRGPGRAGVTGRGGRGGIRSGARGALHSGSSAPIVGAGTRTTENSAFVASTPRQETPAKHSE